MLADLADLAGDPAARPACAPRRTPIFSSLYDIDR
jgi:hypothetical protein